MLEEIIVIVRVTSNYILFWEPCAPWYVVVNMNIVLLTRYFMEQWSGMEKCTICVSALSFWDRRTIFRTECFPFPPEKVQLHFRGILHLFVVRDCLALDHFWLLTLSPYLAQLLPLPLTCSSATGCHSSPVIRVLLLRGGNPSALNLVPTIMNRHYTAYALHTIAILPLWKSSLAIMRILLLE